jgi:trigger factor
MPEINIAGYQDTKIAKEDGRLTDEEFQAELDRIRDARSTMEPVEEERMLQRGDWAQVSYSGFDKTAEGAVPKAEISADEVVIEIGGKLTLEAFTEALTGATVGQEMDVDVSYPEDFGERRLAGKTVAYHLTVKGIKRKVMPELNDEFAKELGEYDSFEDFKTKLRESLEHNKQRRAAAEGRDKLIDALVARFQFPVPETLVQQQVDARLERGLRALAMQGMSADHMRQLNFDRLRTAQRDTALQETKGALILDRIADEEKVEVPDEEVEKQLQYFAMEQREPVETLRQRLTQDGGLARIREQLRREKTGNLLYERLAS